MLPVIWNPEAKTDLQTIVEYIAEHSPQAALSLHDALVRATAKLTQHPLLYRPGE
jgi:plasmid stabilization system protein ParE